MELRRHRQCVISLTLLLTGCGRYNQNPSGTGAKESVRGFYDALVRQDWPDAYAVLNPESQKHCSLQRFSKLGQTYLARIGFEPEKVQVWSCEERDSEATARVVLRGRSASQSRRFNDAITLRRSEEGWRVVLPLNFGSVRNR